MIEFSGVIEDLGRGLRLTLCIDGRTEIYAIPEGQAFLRLQEHTDRLAQGLARKIEHDRKAA